MENCETTLENSLAVPQNVEAHNYHNPAIPLLGIHPELKTGVQTITCTEMCPLHDYSQQSKHGDHPNGQQQINKQNRTPILLLKRMQCWLIRT